MSRQALYRRMEKLGIKESPEPAGIADGFAADRCAGVHGPWPAGPRCGSAASRCSPLAAHCSSPQHFIASRWLARGHRRAGAHAARRLGRQRAHSALEPHGARAHRRHREPQGSRLQRERDAAPRTMRWATSSTSVQRPGRPPARRAPEPVPARAHARHGHPDHAARAGAHQRRRRRALQQHRRAPAVRRGPQARGRTLRALPRRGAARRCARPSSAAATRCSRWSSPASRRCITCRSGASC